MCRSGGSCSTRSRTIRSSCVIWSRRWEPIGCCSDPTTRSTWPTGTRWRRRAGRGWITKTRPRSCTATPSGCSRSGWRNTMPDARVQAAIENWGPRQIANGVDYNDFVRTTSAIERWDEWLDAWEATGDAHHALAMEARETGHLLSAGEAFLRAAVTYHFAKFVWVVDGERNRRVTGSAVRAMYDGLA